MIDFSKYETCILVSWSQNNAIVVLDDYAIHFDLSDFCLKFDVYGCSYNTSSGKLSYESKKGDCRYIDDFDKETCELYFCGSYVWRGVWESRIYFPDDNEYWGERFTDMATLFKDFIEPFCKDVIISRDPDNCYED